jgi:hypothetical protein
MHECNDALNAASEMKLKKGSIYLLAVKVCPQAILSSCQYLFNLHSEYDNAASCTIGCGAAYQHHSLIKQC